MQEFYFLKNLFILLDPIGPNSAESKYARILIFEIFFYFTRPNWTQFNWVQICKNFNFWKNFSFYWTQLDPTESKYARILFFEKFVYFTGPNWTQFSWVSICKNFIFWKILYILLDLIGPNSTESKYERILFFEKFLHFTGPNWTQFNWVQICKNFNFWRSEICWHL